MAYWRYELWYIALYYTRLHEIASIPEIEFVFLGRRCDRTDVNGWLMSTESELENELDVNFRHYQYYFDVEERSSLLYKLFDYDEGQLVSSAGATNIC